MGDYTREEGADPVWRVCLWMGWSVSVWRVCLFMGSLLLSRRSSLRWSFCSGWGDWLCMKDLSWYIGSVPGWGCLNHYGGSAILWGVCFWIEGLRWDGGSAFRWRSCLCMEDLALCGELCSEWRDWLCMKVLSQD